MKVLLVHLSDMHIMNDKDEIFKRVSNIKGAILSLYHNVEKCFLLITGDITFAGTQNQYLLALDFISKLQDELYEEGIEIEIEMVPGNHDCNFKSEHNNGTRHMIISQLRQGEYIIDKSIIITCIKVQENFFQFQKFSTKIPVKILFLLELYFFTLT